MRPKKRLLTLKQILLPVGCELRLKKRLLILRQILFPLGCEMRLKKRLLITDCVPCGVRDEAEEKL